LKTSKPFSTISYNSCEFLQVKLNDLINRRKIAFYGFIEHLPEEDEKKAHKHLYIVPNGQINTDEILDYLLELDPKNPDKPLGCIPFHSSKFTDWYLYSVHDKDYLASKGQSRKYSYQKDEVIVSDSDFFNEEFHRMDLSKLSKVKALRNAVETGVPFEHMLMTGQIPVQQVYAYKQTYDMILSYLDRTHRDGRETHQKINPDTGELITEDDK
jgi:hypothetical protein